MRLLSKIDRGNEHVLAHKHCGQNREEIEKSELCGCFYCMRIFSPTAIHEWVNESKSALRKGYSAICPFYGIDSVIGSAAGYPITAEFLGRMHAHWFESA